MPNEHVLHNQLLTGQEILEAEWKEADVLWCSMLTKANSLPISPGGFNMMSCIMDWNTRWLYSWHMIGLDSEEEAFDIILITHPASVEKLPKVENIEEKDLLTIRSALRYQRTLTLGLPDLANAFGGSSPLSQVLFPMSIQPPGLSERDHRYDRYLNSQECLFNPAASFLMKYR